MKIKSITDVITNSSSEVFLIRTYGKSPEKIYKELIALGEEECSGEGGVIEVINKLYPDHEYEQYINDLDPAFAWIRIDRAKENTINWLKDNYYVISPQDYENWELEEYYKDELEKMKDEDKYLDRIYTWYNNTLYSYSNFHRNFLNQYPNPEAFIEAEKQKIKNWFEEHPTPIIETLRYENQEHN